MSFHPQLFPTSLPQAKKKKNLSFYSLFYSVTLLYCDRNLKNTGGEDLCSLSAHFTVFQLEFRTPDFEVEGDHTSSWFGITTGAARPRKEMAGREV